MPGYKIKGARSRFKRRPRRYARRMSKRRTSRSFYRGVMSIIRPEMKYNYVSNGGAAISTTMVFSSLVNIGQGDTSTTRTGNHITIKNIEIRFTASPGQTAVYGHKVRLGLLVMNQGTDAPSTSEIWNNGTTGVADGALRQQSYMQHYKILWDRYILLGSPVSGGNQDGVAHYFKKFHKQVDYIDATGTNYLKDVYYLWYVTDVAAGTESPNIAYQAKVRFIDA